MRIELDGRGDVNRKWMEDNIDHFLVQGTQEQRLNSKTIHLFSAPHKWANGNCMNINRSDMRQQVLELGYSQKDRLANLFVLAFKIKEVIHYFFL